MTQLLKQSIGLKKDKEPKPEPERRKRFHGRHGYVSVNNQYLCKSPCSSCDTINWVLFSSSYSMKMANAGFMMNHYSSGLLPVNIKWTTCMKLKPWLSGDSCNFQVLFFWRACLLQLQFLSQGYWIHWCSEQLKQEEPWLCSSNLYWPFLSDLPCF